MSQPDRPGLKRVITRNMLLLFVVGDMLGAGIYALVGEVGGRVGGAIWTPVPRAHRRRGLVNVAEEAKDPQRDYPRAVYGGPFIAGCIYLIVAGLASMVVETKTLADSDGPLLEVVQVGPLAVETKIFAAIALVAVSNTALIDMIMASRIVYGMARQGIIPSALGRADGARGTW